MTSNFMQPFHRQDQPQTNIPFKPPNMAIILGALASGSTWVEALQPTRRLRDICQTTTILQRITKLPQLTTVVKKQSRHCHLHSITTMTQSQTTQEFHLRPHIRTDRSSYMTVSYTGTATITSHLPNLV